MLKIIIPILVVGMLLCCMLLAWIGLPGPNAAWNGQKVRDIIDHDLPIGSDKSKVLVLLEQKGISHSGFYDDVDIHHHGQVTASIRQLRRGSIRKPMIYIQFEFDKNGKLTKYSVDEIMTGLP